MDSQTLPMVIYALARRGVNPMLNAVSTVIVVALGAMVLISERLRVGMNRRGFLIGRGGGGGVHAAARRGSTFTTGPITSRRETIPEFRTRIRHPRSLRHLRKQSGDARQSDERKLRLGRGVSLRRISFSRCARWACSLRCVTDWLPNLDSLDASFRHPPWDPELRMEHSLHVGVTGIVYQSSVDAAAAGVGGSVQGSRLRERSPCWTIRRRFSERV